MERISLNNQNSYKPQKNIRKMRYPQQQTQINHDDLIDDLFVNERTPGQEEKQLPLYLRPMCQLDIPAGFEALDYILSQGKRIIRDIMTFAQRPYDRT